MQLQEKKMVNIVVALFLEQGAKFKMEDVASRMKISKKTIYKDYGNKEDLIMLVLKAIFEGIERQLQIVIDSDEHDTVEKLIRLTCTFPDARDIDYHDVILLAKDFPRAHETFLRYIEDNWTMSKTLFDQGVEEGKIKPIDYELFRTITLGITKQVLDSAEVDKEKQMEDAIRLLFDGMRVTAPAPKA